MWLLILAICENSFTTQFNQHDCGSPKIILFDDDSQFHFLFRNCSFFFVTLMIMQVSFYNAIAIKSR